MEPQGVEELAQAVESQEAPVILTVCTAGLRSRLVADASGAPVLRDQGPISRPGTARSILAPENRELGKHPRTTPYGLILQLGRHGHRPWLSVNDRWRPMVRARRGHGQRGPGSWEPGSDGHQPDGRVGPSSATPVSLARAAGPRQPSEWDPSFIPSR
jgi:hypothetical protein